MKVLVFGATGATGRQLVEQGLTLGHEVRAFARDPAALTLRHDRLHVARGDVLDPASVAAALAGQQAVLSALGTPLRRAGHVVSSGVKNIVAGMRAQGVRRLVFLSAFGVGDSRQRAGFVFNRIVRPLVMRGVFDDKERQEAAIRESGLDWVIVRPPRLTDKPARGQLRVSVSGSGLGLTITRADVASFMLKQLTSDEHVGRAVAISN